MAESLSSLVQIAGTLGGLAFTAGYFFGDRKTGRILRLFNRAEKHNAFWGEARRDPELQRVFLDDPDLLAKPISLKEEEFLNSAFLHFEDGWEVAEIANRKRLNILQKDIKNFFSRPLPAAVWAKTKDYRTPQFVKFVKRALEADGGLRPTGA